LAERAAPIFDELSPEAPVPDDAISLPASRLAVPSELLPFASADTLARASHTYGKSYTDRVRGFRGDYREPPDFVVRPQTIQQIEQVLDVAARERLVVVPFGGGSSVVGGVEPRLGSNQRGVVTVDLAAMDRVIEVDEVSQLARIQGGVLGPALEEQLGAHGLTLRHFPQSFEFSSLGGWIATRAGGHFATVYTHIDELVAGVSLLTPRGLLETAPLPGSGDGPDPNRLVCGSEGTLGLIVEAWMRVRSGPRFRASASVRFADFSAAVAATRAIVQSGLHPANCRLLDSNEAFLHGVASDGSAVLVLGFESATHTVKPLIDLALGHATELGGVCRKGPNIREGDGPRAEDDAALWRGAFLDGPYLQDAAIRLGLLADTFETACTWRAFPALYEGVVAATTEALQRVCGGGLVTCRFTHVYPDGPAPYFTFLGKAKRGGELEQWAAIKDAASDALVRFGGAATHHHAVGRMHRPWYERTRPALFRDALRAAKHTLDPQGLLNPGVLIDA
jgi:alkyldihydroxyacetonephosphate synthase